MATLTVALPPSAQELETSDGFLAALSASTHSFLQPSPNLHTATILAAKRFLDPLASDVSQSQEQRRNEKRRKRKRSDVEADGSEHVLQLREVYTEGFEVNQIWEQARRVLEAASAEVERDLKYTAASKPIRSSSVGSKQLPAQGIRMVQFDEDGFEEDSDDSVDLADGDLAEDFGHHDSDEDALDEDSDASLDEEDLEGIEDDLSASSAEKQARTFQPDPNGLNDGFFSIDDFNKESQFLEQKDARGEDDNPSDEDEIDWDADPLTTSVSRPKSGINQDEIGGSEEEDDEAGATFGNVDLNAPFSDDEEEEGVEEGDLADGIGGPENTNDILYADFFEPPPRQPSKTKRMRALPKTQPQPRPETNGTKEDIRDDIERAISDVRRDLLESEDGEEEDDSDELSDASSVLGNSTSKRPSKKAFAAARLSTHEKQRAAIAAEIRRLEAANVSKRDWTLSGEARAVDRPINSLIEEDLEFERVGKPVPVITAEVSEEIEALIKRRILAREFDEVVRRRPDAVSSAADARRGRAAIELDDGKPQQGLAEVYEQDHLRQTDPGYVDKRSAAEKKAQENITRLMKEVFRDLDLLTNNNLKPKKPEVEIQVVGDKPTISMEDARPSASGDGVGEDSMLAPQEIYRLGEERERGTGEVLRKSGAAVSREEMTREEKLRRRRRAKERGKKAKGDVTARQALLLQQGRQRGGMPDSGKSSGRKDKGPEKKRDIIAELKRGGVQVIGKGGKLEDLGKKNNSSSRENNARAMESAGALKL